MQIFAGDRRGEDVRYNNTIQYNTIQIQQIRPNFEQEQHDVL